MGWVSYREDIIEAQDDNRGWYYCPEQLIPEPSLRRGQKQGACYYYPPYDPPRKNKPLVYIPEPFVHEDLDDDREAHNKLLRYLKGVRDQHGVTREWLNTYFDLAKDFLTGTRLVSSDMRLLMSIKKYTSGSYDIPSYRSFLHITVHLRYTFIGYQCEGRPPSIAVMYPEGAWQRITDTMHEMVFLPVMFTNTPKAWLLHLHDIDDVRWFKGSWIRESNDEKRRGKALTRCRYPQSHTPMFYKAVVSPEYRTKLLADI